MKFEEVLRRDRRKKMTFETPQFLLVVILQGAAKIELCDSVLLFPFQIFLKPRGKTEGFIALTVGRLKKK